MANDNLHPNSKLRTHKHRRDAGRSDPCWYCGHNGGDPLKTAQMKANGNFLMGTIAFFLAVIAMKV